MSRLIVKNLPAYLSDVRLREHFSQRGLVTDVKLMTRPDGTSRRFGFVGYRTEQEAQDALEYFNRTFIDTSRIQVEAARKIGDEELAQKREKRLANRQNGVDGARSVASSSKLPAPASSSDAAPKPPKKSKKDKAAEAKSVSFEEFMAVMAPKKKRKTWANEDEDQEARLKAGAADEEERSAKKAKKREQKAVAKKTADAAAADETSIVGATDPIPPPTDDREATPDEALNDEGLTDLDYMHRRMRRNIVAPAEPAAQDEQSKQFEQSDSEDGSDDDEVSDEESEDDADTQQRLEQERLAREEAARKDQEAVDTIMLSGRLFVRNLPFAASEEDLSRHFEEYGPIKQAHIPLDKASKTSKGLAFVSFEEPAHALAAYRGADGSTFQGRLLHLLPAVDLRAPPDAPKTLKQNRSDERKAGADKDFNWSMLYMSADAVASSISDRLGVSKSDILNPSDESKGDSAAVRLALAETRVIQETKEFLENEGVNVGAFDESSTSGSKKRKMRSDTTILVKNIPYGTTSETVRQLFEKHGEVERVLVPPTGTLALVEMAIHSEARVAFKALAYRRLGNSVIYLEKAPVGVMAPSKRSAEDATAKASSKPSIAAPPSKEDARLGAGAGSEGDAEPGATLFVKNLSFATTDTKLAGLFSTLHDFAFARVQTRPDSRDPNKRLSMGYGFVGYRTVEAAQTAVSVLNGKDLDGHSLSLSFAKRGQDADDAAAAGKKRSSGSTKLVVKNLPFEATKKDVRALFGSYGQLKSVRVPRKAAPIAGAAGGGARGFAFVEFSSSKEASSALSALRHTHLLGRHLVIAYDEEDGKGVEGMREKVKEGFELARNAGLKARVRKEKLKLGEEDIAEAGRRERAKKDAEE